MMVNFGKYKGKKLNEVDDSYLKWGAQNLSNPDWKEAFKNELAVRSSKKIIKENGQLFEKLKHVEDLEKYQDPLIFGKNQTLYITNITYNNNKIYIYKSDNSEEVIDYLPWYLNIERKGIKLKGNQYYNYVNEVRDEQYKELSSKWTRTRWFPRSIEEGFMIANGYTYFKGMKATDLSMHSFDIETTGTNPESKDAKVLLISNSIKKNGIIERKLFDIQEFDFNEQAMLEAWQKYVVEKNCDVLIGHNVFGFDLNYLNIRANGLYLGRNGEEVIFEEKQSKFRKDGSQSYEYKNAHVHGRTVVDSLFLSIKYDIARKFPSYGIKVIEKHLKLVDNNRIEWDFNKYPPSEIYKTKNEIWEQFKEYCRQDSDSPIKLFELMAPSLFYMNQSVPKTFQQMINEATGSQLDSIMIRSYLQDGHSIAKSSEKQEFEGAVSMGLPGIYENVRKIDVVSMYPSIMLAHDIYDKQKDPNKHLLKILSYFREERIKNKSLYKKTKDVYYNDLQESQKISINSLYGYLGAGFLLYNFPEGATAVTRYGREIIQKTIEWATGYSIKKDVKKVRNKGKENEETDMHWVLDQKVSDGKGYKLVNVDTDSIAYTNGVEPTEEEFKREIEEVNKLFPKEIQFEDDGVFVKGIVVKAKNYLLQKKNGDVITKGSAFKSSTKEPALKLFQEELTNEILLSNDINKFKTIYGKYINEAKNIQDISRWASKKTYTDKVETSERANETKVVDAINEGLEKKVLNSIQQGDKIYLYQTINGMKQKIKKGEPQFYKRTGEPMMEPNRVLRLTSLFNNDADIEHYVERVNNTLAILESVLDVTKIKT